VSVPRSGSGLRLTLLSRAYCHLCDDLRDALAPIAARHGAEVVELDVDDDPALEAIFGDRVPVVVLGNPDDGTELCHFHLDRARVEAALTAAARVPGSESPLARKADFR
jgi:citrate lyase gamma subunit